MINKKRFLSLLAILFAMMVSPLILLLIVGAVYSLIRVVDGTEYLTAFSVYASKIFALSPYFPYMTATPAIAVLIVLVIRTYRKVIRK